MTTTCWFIYLWLLVLFLQWLLLLAAYLQLLLLINNCHSDRLPSGCYSAITVATASVSAISYLLIDLWLLLFPNDCYFGSLASCYSAATVATA